MTRAHVRAAGMGCKGQGQGLRTKPVCKVARERVPILRQSVEAVHSHTVFITNESQFWHIRTRNHTWVICAVGAAQQSCSQSTCRLHWMKASGGPATTHAMRTISPVRYSTALGVAFASVQSPSAIEYSNWGVFNLSTDRQILCTYTFTKSTMSKIEDYCYKIKYIHVLLIRKSITCPTKNLWC